MGEQLALLDYGRGKYHASAEGQPGHDGWTACGMRLNGGFRIKFEDEVAPEDLCKTCRARVCTPNQELGSDDV
jgi:hypothetical protein